MIVTTAHHFRFDEATMKTTIFQIKTAALLGSAKPKLAKKVPAVAQQASPGQELPAIVVQQNKPRTAKPKPARVQRASRATSRRAATNRGQVAPDAAAAGTKPETATSHVDGYLATVSGTGTMTDTPLRETPQTITVVSADQVQDQAATTIQESVRYVPGVFADAYGPDSRGDYPRIRGQDPNIYLDGTRVMNTWQVNEWRPDPYTLERIEILRKPATEHKGKTSTAGLLNLISLNCSA